MQATNEASRSSRRSRQPLWTRRAFLGAVSATATGVALSFLGVLPPARRALAGHGSSGYLIRGDCAGVNYSDTCADPCDVAPICSDCCITDSSQHFYGYHKSTGSYALRYNQCYDGSSEGWNWQTALCCGFCKYPKFRCHDGKKNGNPTVCKWTITCPACASPCACID